MKFTITPNNTLHIHLTSLNKLAAAQFSDIDVPLQNVKLPVKVRPEEAKKVFKAGMKVGTAVPWGFTAGNFYHHDKNRDFHFYANADRTLEIDLVEHPTYARLFLEVDEGEVVDEVAKRIEKAVEAVGGRKME
ncbi:hypothetical protein HK102_010418 [Quaeritorhiza haematococci]|nr:hypothetical protein HK102_010418 [Quaeritorhiza haematococci]